MLLTSAFAGVLPAQKAEIISADLSLVDDLAVPNELFFVREHFPQPDGISAAGWSLAVGGRNYSLDQITALPSKTLPVTLECAENPASGGLVSHAEWTGIPLASLLPSAANAQSVKFTSADGFSRAIPVAKALHPDTLVAFAMNGEKLPPNHGFPLRLIVPGWYAMASIKWLRAVELIAAAETPRDYLRQRKGFFGTTDGDPVTAIQVKSAFTRPQDSAILMKRRFTLRGMAWAGENRIAKVEVSVDGAKSWRPATLGGPPVPYAWAPWSFDWRIPAAGDYTLAVRASDDKGQQQPAQRDTARADAYEWNSWQTMKVTVA